MNRQHTAAIVRVGRAARAATPPIHFELKTNIAGAGTTATAHPMHWSSGWKVDASEASEFELHFPDDWRHYWPATGLARLTDESVTMPGARGTASRDGTRWVVTEMQLPIVLGKVQTRATNFGSGYEATDLCSVKRCTGNGTERGDAFDCRLEPWQLGSQSRLTNERPGMVPAVFTGDVLVLRPFRRPVLFGDEVAWVAESPPVDAARYFIRPFYAATTSLPRGWHVCDGNNGTPNLIDKVLGGAGGTKLAFLGSEFGSDEHAHTHRHTLGSDGPHADGFADGIERPDEDSTAASSWQPTHGVHWAMRTH